MTRAAAYVFTRPACGGAQAAFGRRSLVPKTPMRRIGYAQSGREGANRVENCPLPNTPPQAGEGEEVTTA